MAKQSHDMHAISCQADESRQTITDVCVVDAVWPSSGQAES